MCLTGRLQPISFIYELKLFIIKGCNCVKSKLTTDLLNNNLQNKGQKADFEVVWILTLEEKTTYP